MNKSNIFAFAAALMSLSATAQTTPVGQMEKLDRGLVVVPSSTGTSGSYFLSWRLFGTDDDNTTFDVLRDGVVAKSGLDSKTNFVDNYGLPNSQYQIVTKQNGVATDTSAVVTPWSSNYKEILLDRPASMTMPDNSVCTFSPNDCSVGDVDGDGQYELIVKWDPDNSKDNSQSGYTGNVYIDCYKLDGTKLWRIDLGKNIRAGAHYTQFLVYDFDGDGKAEMICKTAPGSKDGAGNYVSSAATDSTILTVNNTADWRNSSGKIKGGQEYLTVFNGETGKAIHTIFYNPNRAMGYGGAPSWTVNWDTRSGKTDTEYGNRGERYLATVAYLGGADENPSAVMCRGYYTYAFLWAVDFDGKELKQRWFHASKSTTKYSVTDADGNTTEYTADKATRGSGSNTAMGNGNHNLSCGDVDGDGDDEIIWGSCGIDHDGKMLYATGYGHGDANHMSDLIPDRPGLEMFEVHEESPYGWDVHDAATGEILHSATGESDNGRGLSADIDDSNRGFEFWSSNDRGPRSATSGSTVSSKSCSVNFRMYWDGDLQDELLDGGKLDKWNGAGTTRLYPVEGKNFYDFGSSCNSSKSTPNLSADIFGDWREELILHTDSSLVLFTTNIETDFRVPTLMHDHVYRLGVAWQNVAYNQPPHLGYYLPDIFKTEYVKLGEGDFNQSIMLGDSIKTIYYKWRNCGSASFVKATLPDGTAITSSTADFGGLTFARSTKEKTFTIAGTPTTIGTYTLVVKSGKNVVDESIRYDTITIVCNDPAAINTVEADDDAWVTIADNTFSDNITLNFNTNKALTANVSVFNAAGAKVASRIVKTTGAAKIAIGGLSRLQSGVYIVNVESTEGTVSKKIIKR